MSIKNVRKDMEHFRLPVGEDGNVVVPFDNAGKKDYGAVQRHFRIFEKGWTTEEFSIKYAEALKEMCEEEEEQRKEAKVTARWIRMMEQKNCVPDGKRRWIIATLLGIPAASFGLTPLAPLTKIQEMTAFPGNSKKPLDIAAYTAFLQRSWTLNHTNTAQTVQNDITRRIKKLHAEILYGRPEEYKQMMRLLCYYHQLNANIDCDQQRLADAIDSMNKAYKIAKLLQSSELQALVLFRRGFVYFGSGYKTIAANDFDAAMKLIPSISQPLKGAILLAAGQGHAVLAQTEKDQTKFLHLLDLAHNSMGQGGIFESEHFMGFDEESYIRDRATALTLPSSPKLHVTNEASDLIDKLQASSITPRREAIISRLEAKIYLDKGYHKMAASRALDALNTLSYTYNTIDVMTIYQNLQESKYRDIKEVTDLGLALLKAQQPQLFN